MQDISMILQLFGGLALLLCNGKQCFRLCGIDILQVGVIAKGYPVVMVQNIVKRLVYGFST